MAAKALLHVDYTYTQDVQNIITELKKYAKCLNVTFASTKCGV